MAVGAHSLLLLMQVPELAPYSLGPFTATVHVAEAAETTTPARLYPLARHSFAQLIHRLCVRPVLAERLAKAS